METAILIGLKAIGAGLVMFAGTGAGIGIGLIGMGALLGISRNPTAASTIQTNMIIACVLAEMIALYSLVVGVLIIFVL